jgi:hypothetical protein
MINTLCSSVIPRDKFTDCSFDGSGVKSYEVIDRSYAIIDRRIIRIPRYVRIPATDIINKKSTCKKD